MKIPDCNFVRTICCLDVWVLSFFLGVAAVSAYAGPPPLLDCSRGLVIRLYLPSSGGSEHLRTGRGVELEVSKPLMTVTKHMVNEAVISRHGIYNGRQAWEKKQAPADVFFWVALILNSDGERQLLAALSGKRTHSLVVTCGSRVLIAGAVPGKQGEEIDVLLENDSKETAERLARFFTSKVRFDPTPGPD